MKTSLLHLLGMPGREWVGQKNGDLKIIWVSKRIDPNTLIQVEQLIKQIKKDYHIDLDIVGFGGGCLEVVFVVDNKNIKSLLKEICYTESFLNLVSQHGGKIIILGEDEDIISISERITKKGKRIIKDEEEFKDIEIVIMTIREDEMESILEHLKPYRIVKGKRYYNKVKVNCNDGITRIVAVVRCIDQGSNEAQATIQDTLEDITPKWVFLCGIAAGLPTSELTLGDVILSSEIYDFTLRAEKENEEPEFDLKSCSLHFEAKVLLANLPAFKKHLSEWSKDENIMVKRPIIAFRNSSLYGSDEWKKDTKSNLQRGPRQEPIFHVGKIASSDNLIKKTLIPTIWRQTARHIEAIEMECVGVYRALEGKNIPFFTVRGISDIVGLKREAAWTSYACHSCSSFLYHFLKLECLYGKL